jgi:hypothetical protein
LREAREIAKWFYCRGREGMDDPPIEELGAAMAVGEVLFVVVVGGCGCLGPALFTFVSREALKLEKRHDETPRELARLQKLGG